MKTQTRRVFVLSGESGRYSDTILWTVGVYASELGALAKRDELLAILRKHNLADWPDDYMREWDAHCARCRAAEKELRQIDPNTRVQVSGISYEIVAHTVIDAE